MSGRPEMNNNWSHYLLRHTHSLNSHELSAIVPVRCLEYTNSLSPSHGLDPAALDWNKLWPCRRAGARPFRQSPSLTPSVKQLRDYGIRPVLHRISLLVPRVTTYHLVCDLSFTHRRL
jgi:hypothetical protein